MMFLTACGPRLLSELLDLQTARPGKAGRGTREDTAGQPASPEATQVKRPAVAHGRGVIRLSQATLGLGRLNLPVTTCLSGS